jgi:hypothetical protein
VNSTGGADSGEVGGSGSGDEVIEVLDMENDAPRRMKIQRINIGPGGAFSRVAPGGSVFTTKRTSKGRRGLTTEHTENMDQDRIRKPDQETRSGNKGLLL